MLESATEHYARQQRITAAGLVASRRAWKRRDLAQLVAVVTAAQLVAARDAADSVPLMLAEQDISTDAAGEVNPRALAGVASDGRSLDTLLAIPETLGALEMLVATQIQDAARGAAGVSVAARPAATGYVRMLNPPSCSRCAVLAGKKFKWNSGFERHPRCDCRHIPSSEALMGDLTTNPDAYFESLPSAAELSEQYPDLTVKMRREAGLYSQEDIFTNSGAQALRDGADMSQVVNARSGMSTANIGGRSTVITTDGTTRRAAASMTRTGRNMSDRVMPETIYEIATSRADAIRLLKLNGFILP